MTLTYHSKIHSLFREHTDVRLIQSIPHILLDPVKVTKELCSILRTDHQVDYIIALTHMRVPEEMRLIEECPEVDLFLGGHDHEYLLIGEYTQTKNIAQGAIKLIKSGSDFEQFSVIHFNTKDNIKGFPLFLSKKEMMIPVTRHDISAETLNDTLLEGKLKPINEFISTLLEKKVMYTTTPLQGQANTLRNQETNLGNLIADTFKEYFNVDLSLINSGAIRCDRVIPVGVLRLSDLIDIMPFQNPIFVKKATGRIIRLALENGLRDSRIDGRFLHISGIRIVIDLNRREGSRITQMYFENGEIFDETREYRFAVSSFVCAGGDGFTMLKDLKGDVEGEEGISETEIMLSVFGDLKIVSDLNAVRTRKVVIKGMNMELPVVSSVKDNRINQDLYI